MSQDKMIYMEAAQGRCPSKMPIVIEIQMLITRRFLELEKKYGFEGICKNPELSAECTVAPIEDFGFDAAIHMSDLSILLEAFGAKINFGLKDPSRVVSNPIRSESDIEKFSIPEPEEAMKVWLEGMRLGKKALQGKVPLIGWVGAPLSTSAFLVEGGFPSGVTPFNRLKRMIYEKPALFHKLLDKITSMYEKFIPAQVEAGADIIMVLDLFSPSSMSPHNYLEFCYPYATRLVKSIKNAGAAVFFASDGTSFMSAPLNELDIDVVGFDWTIKMSDAIKRLGENQVVQGNLEPHCLFAPEDVIEKRVRGIVEEGKNALSHIFSLGGWIVRGTPPEKVKFLVDLVHSL